MRFSGNNVPDKFHKHRKRHAFRRSVLAMLIAAIVLSVGGFAYSWYSSLNGEVAEAPVPAPAPTNPLSTAPKIPSASARVGVSAQSFPSEAKIGENVTMSIKTLPGAACSIVFIINDDNERSSDLGLVPRVADEYGLVEWTWQVSQAEPGTRPVEIVCANGAKSGNYTAELEVTR